MVSAQNENELSKIADSRNSMSISSSSSNMLSSSSFGLHNILIEENKEFYRNNLDHLNVKAQKKSKKRWK